MIKIKSEDKEIEIQMFNFKTGESNIKIVDVLGLKEVIVQLIFESNEDLISLMFVVDALKRNHVQHINLEMLYVPYSRQDRVFKTGNPLALKSFSDFINSLGFNKVFIIDPHSSVTSALLNNLEITSKLKMIEKIFDFGHLHKNINLIAPDAGALKEVLNIGQKLNAISVYRADKRRCEESGGILETVVFDKIDNDSDILIIDDICDGGRTFIELAKAIRSQCENKIHLYVSHGFFTYGVEVFDGLIDKIFCANLMNKQVDKDRLIILN